MKVNSMILHPPIVISARLLPSVKCGNAHISIEYSTRCGDDNRTRYTYHIDTPDWEHTGDDIQSGCGGGSLQSGLESLLSFLSACGESVAYHRRSNRPIDDDSNANLFPEHVANWCHTSSDELSMLAIELEEMQDLIEE